jgi:hypothetical protein
MYIHYVGNHMLTKESTPLKGNFVIFYMLAKYVPGDIKYIFTKFYTNCNSGKVWDDWFWKIIIDCRWNSNNRQIFDHNWWSKESTPLKGNFAIFYMLAKYVPGDIKYIFTKFYRHISTNNEANRKFVILISNFSTSLL